MPAGIPTLRRDQPYGTIHPPHNGASISQWGALYDHGGTFLGFEDELGQEKFDEATARARRENRSANLAPSDLQNAGSFAPGAVDTEAERALQIKERENAARREAIALEREELELAERKAKLDPAAAKAAAEAEAKRKKESDDAAAAANKPKAKPAGGDTDGEDGTGTDKPTTGSVDLKAWAMGDEQYPFFLVKKAAQEQYSGIIVTNTKTIVDGLVARGVLTDDEVKR